MSTNNVHKNTDLLGKEFVCPETKGVRFTVVQAIISTTNVVCQGVTVDKPTTEPIYQIRDGNVVRKLINNSQKFELQESLNMLKKTLLDEVLDDDEITAHCTVSYADLTFCSVKFNFHTEKVGWNYGLVLFVDRKFYIMVDLATGKVARDSDIYSAYEKCFLTEN